MRQAALPSRPIERGRPGQGLLAHVLVSKYADHLPLYRQSQIFEREGLDLSRSTLADWVGQSAALLEPLCKPEDIEGYAAVENKSGPSNMCITCTQSKTIAIKIISCRIRIR